MNGYKTMNGGLKYPFLKESESTPMSVHPLDQVLNHGGKYTDAVADNMVNGVAIALAYLKLQGDVGTKSAQGDTGTAPAKVQVSAPLIPPGNIATLAAHP